MGVRAVFMCVLVEFAFVIIIIKRIAIITSTEKKGKRERRKNHIRNCNVDTGIT